MIDRERLSWLLDGLSIEQKKAFKDDDKMFF